MRGKVRIRDTRGGVETYDRVVMACHGDEALALLRDAAPSERAALSAFRYQKNLAVLHRDHSVMPKRRRCWANVLNSRLVTRPQFGSGWPSSRLIRRISSAVR